jgi:hypothetical protein
MRNILFIQLHFQYFNTSKGCTKKSAAIAKGDITSVPARTITSKRVKSVLRVTVPQKLHYISKFYPVFVQCKNGRNANFVAADGIRQCNQPTNRTVSGLEKLIFVQYRNYLPLLRANIHLRARNRQLLSQSMSVLSFKHYFPKIYFNILFSMAHSVPALLQRCFIVDIICEFIVNISDVWLVNHAFTDLITVVNFGEEYKLWSSLNLSCVIFFHPHVTPSLSVRSQYSPYSSVIAIRQPE